MGEWAVRVVGDAAMVQRLAAALGSGARVRIDYDPTFLVRPEWQEVPSSHELDALGRAFLKRANGLMRLAGGFVAPLRFGGVVCFGDGGERTFYDRSTGTLKLSTRTRVRTRATNICKRL